VADRVSGWLADVTVGPYWVFLEGFAGTRRLNTRLAKGFFEGGAEVSKSQALVGEILTDETERQLVLAGEFLRLFHTSFRRHGDTAVSDKAGEDDVQESNDGWEEPRTMALADGTYVLVREIQSEDASALQRLVDRLSERSIHLRYFGPMRDLSDERARHFAEVDGVDRYALVALAPEDDGEIVAVVRYDRQGNTNRAEYAALVEDRLQGLGLGLGLTRALIEAARERGIRDLEALVLPENRGMIGLLRSLDLPERVRRENGVKHFSIDLFPEEAATSS
jgi:RimJ/RimL family protein N-acetyltransferase